MPETFTKDEIWEAVLQMGGAQEDMTAEDVEKSKSEFFSLLDAVVKNRVKVADVGTGDKAAEPESSEDKGQDAADHDEA
jgi:hypothetical protein